MSALKQYLITTTLATLASSVFAQNYLDVIKLDHTEGLTQYSDSAHEPTAFNESTADITLPIVISEKTAIVTGTWLEHSHFQIADQNPRDLYSTLLKIGLNHKIDSHWSATLVLLPKLSSDLKVVDKNQFQLGALALMKYEVNPSLSYKFGAYINNDLYGPMLVPIVGLYFNKGPWEVNAALPITADASYGITKSVRVGAKFLGTNKSVRLNDGSDTYIHRINNELSTYLSYRLGNIVVLAHGGYSAGRSFDSYQNGDKMNLAVSALRIGDKRQATSGSFGDGAFVKLALHYRINLDK
ncbi:MAG: DUF6268 family outer membrane beta-barrel protein [Flavobacteriales bacterium]